jgi:MFS family permease
MLERVLAQSQVPEEHRRTFRHLYLDVLWFGVLSGSSSTFLPSMGRLGATTTQIGLVAAVTAATSLVLALPSGRWLEQRPIGPATFWSSIFHRLGYVAIIPLPWLLTEADQVWGLILIAALMAIPLSALTSGFNSLFAQAVPSTWRAHVAGVRGATLAIAFMLSAVTSGFILEQVAFPGGYQIVFGLGAVGAAMSSLHIYPVHGLFNPIAAAAGHPPPCERRLMARLMMLTSINALCPSCGVVCLPPDTIPGDSHLSPLQRQSAHAA